MPFANLSKQFKLVIISLYDLFSLHKSLISVLDPYYLHSPFSKYTPSFLQYAIHSSGVPFAISK